MLSKARPLVGINWDKTTHLRALYEVNPSIVFKKQGSASREEHYCDYGLLIVSY